jgi:hypothetical protein
MARDWRRIALAVIAVAALAGLSAPSLDAQIAKRPAKAAEADDTEPKTAENKDTEAKAPAKKKQDPVQAQRAIESAAKLVQGGKGDQAVQTLTGVLHAGNLPPPIMAKALYTRGIAHRQKSQPAQAISDLTSALWLKGGLNEADRADALKQRAAAYADAGLTEGGEAVAASVPAARERPTSSAKNWSTETSASAPTSSSGGWLENLFGASAAPSKTPPPRAAGPPPTETASIQQTDPPPAPAERPASRVRISKAWSNATEVHADGAAPSPAVAAPRAPAPASDPSPTPTAAGKYRVQLATVRSQAEARALAAKAKQQHASALAAREPEIDQTVLGNMGAFYRVRFGPYATLQETQAVCARLKGSGFDCMSVTQ